mgnify:CR=1 FL=1
MSNTNSNTATFSEEEKEIDLLQLFFSLKKHLFSIIVVSIIFAVAAVIGTMLFIAPRYRTNFTLYVNNKLNTSEQTTNISNSDLQAARSLASTYSEIIGGRSVLEDAAKMIGLIGDYNNFKGMVQGVPSSTSEIITVYVTSTSPDIAKAYAEAIIVVAESQIAAIVDGSSMSVIDQPYTPTDRYSPSYKKNAVIGFAAGFVMMCAIVIIRDLLDDRVKGEDEIEKNYGFVILGTIPNNWSASKSGGYYEYGKSSDHGSSEHSDSSGSSVMDKVLSKITDAVEEN